MSQERSEGKRAGRSREHGPSRGIVMLLALALAAIAVQSICFVKASRERAPLLLNRPSPLEEPSAPNGSFSGSASRGTIRMDRLIAGLVKLEESSGALTRAQARTLLGILGAANKSQMRIIYMSARLSAALTAPQRDFLNDMAARPGTTSIGRINSESVRRVKEKLVRIAGREVDAVIQVPDEPPGEPPQGEQRRPFVPMFSAFVNLYDEMERAPGVAVTRAQAAEILSILNAWTPPADPGRLSADLLAALTKEQKKQIDELVKSIPDRPEAVLEYPMKLDELLNSKAR